jgi:hypothetical protein
LNNKINKIEHLLNILPMPQLPNFTLLRKVWKLGKGRKNKALPSVADNI